MATTSELTTQQVTDALTDERIRAYYHSLPPNCVLGEPASWCRCFLAEYLRSLFPRFIFRVDYHWFPSPSVKWVTVDVFLSSVSEFCAFLGVSDNQQCALPEAAIAWARMFDSMFVEMPNREYSESEEYEAYVDSEIKNMRVRG